MMGAVHLDFHGLHGSLKYIYICLQPINPTEIGKRTGST